MAQACIVPLFVITTDPNPFAVKVHAQFNQTIPADIENKYIHLKAASNGAVKAVLASAGKASNFTLDSEVLKPANLPNDVSVLGNGNALLFINPKDKPATTTFTEQEGCNEQDTAELQLHPTAGVFCIKTESDGYTKGVYITNRDTPNAGCTVVVGKVIK